MTAVSYGEIPKLRDGLDEPHSDLEMVWVQDVTAGKWSNRQYLYANKKMRRVCTAVVFLALTQGCAIRESNGVRKYLDEGLEFVAIGALVELSPPSPESVRNEGSRIQYVAGARTSRTLCRPTWAGSGACARLSSGRSIVFFLAGCGRT